MSGGIGVVPDAYELVGCCHGAAEGTGCTCWRPVLEPEPGDQLQEGPHAVRASACSDCAFRAGSRERLAGDEPTASRDARFYCHDGMPAVTGYRHPAIAATLVLDDQAADYQPRRANDVVWRADGSPGDLCAGWAALVAYPRTPGRGDAR